VLSYGAAEQVERTNEQGRYNAPDFKRLRKLTVLHRDDAFDEKTFSTGAGAASSERDLHRTLSSGVKVTGRVLGTDGETPVANAAISIDGRELAKSGDDGTFTVAHATSRWSMLTARKDTLIAQQAFAKDKAYTLRLAKAATISGRVTDVRSRAALAGVVISASTRRFGGTEPPLTVETDAKGQDSLVVPAGRYSMWTTHPAYDGGEAEITAGVGQQAARDFAIPQLARVSGVVTNDENRPVAAAVVVPENAGDPFRNGPPMRMMMREEQFFSGPEGRFSARVAPEVALTLRAVKRGFPAAKSEQLRLASGERKSGIVLTIPSGFEVTGRVTDAEGKGLSGVAVTTAPSLEGRGGMFARTIVIGGAAAEEDPVRTSSDGTYSLRAAEGTYDFTFRREGYAPLSVRAQRVAPAAPARVDATLEPASEITGRVTRGGVGVENVSVSSFTPSFSVSTTTGPDGSFTLSGLAAGQLRAMLRKEDDFIMETRMLTAPSRDVVIDLAAGGRVTGRVVDKATNKPITTFQAGVSVSRGGGGMMMMAPPQLRSFTSEDGSFTLENVPAGAMSLVANAPGYASGRLNVTIEEGKTLSDIELPLDAGVRLVGRVTGPNGSPLSDVTVRVAPSATGSFSTRGMEASATTDANGDYTLEAMTAGEESISFSHPKYVSTSKTVMLKGSESRLDVQLSSGQRVTGVVVTEAGAPVADAQVDAGSAGGGFESARTNASGTFELESMKPGRYRFTARKAGLGQATVEDVDISSGAPVRITLAAGAVITGRVSGLPPQDLPTTTVEARAGRTFASATVDTQGNFRMEGAPTGTVQISASVASRDISTRRSSATQTIELEPGGSQSVEIAFRNDITIRGRVPRNGAPLSTASVIFNPRRGSQAQTFFSATTDEKGQYTLSGVEEGEYNVEVIDLQRFSPYSTTYTVRGSDMFDIDYRTSGIRGRVVDAANGEAILNANVQLQPQGQSDGFRMLRGASSDTAGTFQIESVQPGNYVVTTSRDGYANQVLDVTVPESGVENLEVKLTRNDGVTLRVVDARDNRPIRAAVFVYNAQGQLVYESGRMFGGDDDANEVRLPVAPGQYTASVTATGYAPLNISLQSPSLRVALTPGGTLLVRSKHSERRRFRILDANGLPYGRFMTAMPTRE
ncbi:MAG TPA: carboxypeptidase regulatory-like domain-containing protein, partial [Thermoanaerobaculia bacterium]|nr:carboxypeptidase regulatory-like domain-containing protein [Thermoanaerobaculia bacterium]